MCLDVHVTGLARGHCCGFAQEGPSERRGDDWRRLDSSNAEDHDCMSLSVLSC